MKLRTLLLTSIAGITSVNAALIATEEHNLNTWQDEITSTVSTTATFTDTFAGAWGTFDIEILVEAVAADTTTPIAMILSGSGLDLSQDDQDFTFTVSLANVALNTDYSLENLTFTSLKFNAGGANNDSGTLVGPWGSTTWQDGNSTPADHVGHDTVANRHDVYALNGNSAVTSFSHEYEEPAATSSYRINDLKATVEVHMTVVPEPASSTLFGLAGFILLIRRRR